MELKGMVFELQLYAIQIPSFGPRVTVGRVSVPVPEVGGISTLAPVGNELAAGLEGVGLGVLVGTALPPGTGAGAVEWTWPLSSSPNVATATATTAMPTVPANRLRAL